MPSHYELKPKFKEIKCVSCDNTTTVGIKTRKPWRCFHCGLKAAIDAQRQMHAKKGPVYDKWRARMVGWALTQGRTTPPTP